MMYLELFLTFIIALIVIKGEITVNTKLRLVDTPNDRSLHKNPIPTAGGVGIIFSVLLVFALFHFELFRNYAYIFTATLAVLIVGFVDDWIDLKPKKKLAGIALAAIILCCNGFYIETLGSYFGYEIALPWAVAVIFTLFAVIGFTNAMNLVDGIDGLDASLGVVILSGFLAIGLKYDDTLIVSLASLMIAAHIAFLLFNWYPATLFMGDAGSLTLGFVISVLAIQSLEYITPTAVLFFAAIPILDTTIVVYRRIQRHRSIFTADNIHLHHIIYMKKDDTRFTVLALSLMQVVLTMIGYSAIDNSDLFNLIHFGIIFYIYVTFFDQRVRRRHEQKD